MTFAPPQVFLDLIAAAAAADPLAKEIDPTWIGKGWFRVNRDVDFNGVAEAYRVLERPDGAVSCREMLDGGWLAYMGDTLAEGSTPLEALRELADIVARHPAHGQMPLLAVLLPASALACPAGAVVRARAAAFTAYLAAKAALDEAERAVHVAERIVLVAVRGGLTPKVEALLAAEWAVEAARRRLADAAAAQDAAERMPP